MLVSGFFDSINHDRTYSAKDFSDYFEGLISDGIYAGVGKEFNVSADGSGMTIKVDTGRAKILNRYVRNTDILEIEIDAADSTNPRWDAVCVSVNLDEAYRSGYVDIHKGIPATDPQKPDVPDTNAAKLFVLAYVYVPAQATEIVPENISDNRGAANCPYVVGITGTENIVNVVQEAATNAQTQIAASATNAQSQVSSFVTDTQSEVNAFVTNAQTQVDTFLADSETELRTLEVDFNVWWNDKKQNEIKLLEDTTQYTVTNGNGDVPVSKDRYSLDDEVAGKAVANVYKNGLYLTRNVDYAMRYTDTFTYFVLTTVNDGDKITIQILKISS